MDLIVKVLLIFFVFFNVMSQKQKPSAVLGTLGQWFPYQTLLNRVSCLMFPHCLDLL